MAVNLNLLTGKRPTLAETRKFKAEGVYGEMVVNETKYKQFHKLSKEQQQTKIDKILKRHRSTLGKKNSHSNNVQKSIHRNMVEKRERKMNKDIKPIKPIVPFEKLKNKNGDILFEIVGIHSKGTGRLEPYLNEYHFHVTEKTNDVEYLQVGAMALVDTKLGFKRILITKIIKPRSEERMKEVRKFQHTRKIIPETWIRQVKNLERLGKIKPNATFR